jgi:hypothetical protein
VTRPALRDATEIVLAHGRAYLYRAKYPQLVVFTRYVSELDLLVRTFGGHTYKHLAGYVWQLSAKAGLAALLEKVKPHLPSETGFEHVLDKK